MIERIPVEAHLGLGDYGALVHLAGAVQSLRAEARCLVPELGDRKIWMLSSTAVGGGVAEMMPRLVSLLQEVGASVEWVVMRPSRPEFFALTKRLHNLIHGEGNPELTAADRALYDLTSEECARALRPLLAPQDLLVVHDPQPMGVGASLKRSLGLSILFRSHIGLNEETTQTTAAWNFLRPYGQQFDHAVFSATEYIRDFLAGRSSIIRPGLDPMSHKNRDLQPHKLVGVLSNAGLVAPYHPVVTPPFEDRALRLQPDGSFRGALDHEEIGLMYRPIVTQVSRWDRLKGFLPLLRAFAVLKQDVDRPGIDPRHRRRLQILRLVLAGPDPASIADDPEAKEVLQELAAAYARLPPGLQEDVAILLLPMVSVKHNALMVNGLQRCSTVVVQNSLREGFGLTATEAMWKGIPVLGSQAWGLRQQIRDGLDGRLIPDPNDTQTVAGTLYQMLQDPMQRLRWGQSGQRHVHDEFLVLTQVRRWLQVTTSLIARQAGASRPMSLPRASSPLPESRHA